LNRLSALMDANPENGTTKWGQGRTFAYRRVLRDPHIARRFKLFTEMLSIGTAANSASPEQERHEIMRMCALDPSPQGLDGIGLGSSAAVVVGAMARM
jgi:mevalonate kinase